jgi:hypothetical protein
MHEYPTRLHSPTRRIRPPMAPLPGTGPQTRTSPCARTHTQDAEPATGAMKLSGTRANRPSGAFGRQYGGGPESMQTDGFTLFTTELLALTLMALPDHARQYGPVRDCER